MATSSPQKVVFMNANWAPRKISLIRSLLTPADLGSRVGELVVGIEFAGGDR